MPTSEDLKTQARAQARDILAHSEAFLKLPRSQQMSLYQHVVDEQYQKLRQQHDPTFATQSSLATGFAADVPDRTNPMMKNAGNTVSDLKNKVDFPGFVRDLLVGVFDANLDANQRQMDYYKELLREAVKDVTEFVRKIQDAEAYDRLAQDNGYALRYPPVNPLASPTFRPPVVIDKNQNEVNSTEVQAKLNDAKLAMAQERRTLLRETLLMGVSRLVVEQGTIQAKVNFTIDANQNTTYHDTANETDYFTDSQITEESEGHLSFWRGRGSTTNSSRTKTSNISIVTNANADTTNTANLHADLMGFVEIKFKSDYFKLDNFTQVFDLGKGQIAKGPPPEKTNALPASGNT